MIEYSTGLEKIIRKRINQGCDYLGTLRTLYGADPRKVWDIFKRFRQDSSEKIGLTNSYPEFPEPHPAYSQWRLTQKSAKNILEKLVGKNYRSICFLGCPILGIEFQKTHDKRSILLDIDKTILEYAKKFTEILQYDVNEKTPIKLRNRFQCTIIDPPWYYDDVKLFIKRATELTKIGGSIYSSLPRLLTKPSILEERLDFQKWLSDSKIILAELNPIVEYEVPPFEYMAYKDIPAFSGEPWRIGDWIKIKKLENSFIKLNIKESQVNWIEYTFDDKRVFLREKQKEVSGELKLSSLYDDGSLVLKTVSKRSPLVPKIDIWTSRNAVLHIDSGFRTVKTMLDCLNKKDKKIVREKGIDKIRELISI